MTTPTGIDPAVYEQALADIRAIPSTPPPADGRKPPTERDDCGSQRGYQWHRRHGEHACQRCLRANTVAYARRVMKPAGSEVTP